MSTAAISALVRPPSASHSGRSHGVTAPFPALIPPDVLEEIKSRADLLELVGAEVELKRQGRRWVGNCPFHDDLTPSFTVTPDKGLFGCFGCEVHGDVIDWIMSRRGLAFPSAVAWLAADLGIRLNAAAGDSSDRTDLVAARRQAQAERQAELEAERREEWARVAEVCRKRWDAAGPANPLHSYLVAKGIQGPISMDWMRQEADSLIVAMRGPVPDSSISSLQTITPDGTKRFAAGGRTRGTWMALTAAESPPDSAVYVTEGFATAWSIHQVTGAPVFVAFTANNLLDVTRHVIAACPGQHANKSVILAADNDRSGRLNPGVTAARAVAAELGVRVAIPDFAEWAAEGKGPSDFNDLHQREGDEAVRYWLDPDNADRAVTAPTDPSRRVITGHPGSLGQSSEQTRFGQDDASSEGGQDWQAALDAAIEELNRKHFVVDLMGTVVIARSESDAALGRDRLIFSNQRDLRLFYSNRHIATSVKKTGQHVMKPLGDAWLSNPHRRTYQNVALITDGEVPEGTYNLWRGLGVEPKQGSWAAIRQHLLDVACRGSSADYEWLLQWMARCVQLPGERAEVALVLRGAKGAGKGAVAAIMESLFRHHTLSISNSKHLVGNFNSHLADVLLLFLDEAFWAGNKTDEATLKALVTQPTMMIEPKGVNAFSMPNRLKIIMASNADWVVPATADERRYFVLDVSDQRRGDPVYFKRLFRAIKGDELAGLLYDLLEMDLSDFDHRFVPHTAALNRQKLVGGDSFVRFWHDCLSQGEVVTMEAPRRGLEPDSPRHAGWPEDIVAQDLHQRYVQHANRLGERHPITISEMGRRIREVAPGLRARRPCRPWGNQAKPNRYFLPALDVCRVAFLDRLNITNYDWPEIEGEP